MNKEAGVIVGRFQTPYLHEGHLKLIDEVVERHKKVLILVGSTPGVLVTRNNPLDFYTRKLMIQESYPNILVLPINDKPSDEDWSSDVDDRISEAIGDHCSPIMYGSRDSFIPSYKGKYKTEELDESVTISATEVRSFSSDDVRSSSDFRRGVVYAAYNKHPTTYTTVDVPIIDNKGNLLLGRKSSDIKGKWRFIGGFVDPVKDSSLEEAAKREATEETSNCIEFDPNFNYIGSAFIDDWRYKKEKDKIMTSVFVAKYLWGNIKGGDDISELSWFKIDENLRKIVSGQHISILEMLINNSPKKGI